MRVDIDGKTHWSHPEIKQSQENDYGRYNMVSEKYKDTLYIFGGGKLFNQASKVRECVSQMVKLDPNRRQWKTIPQGGKVQDGRKSACSWKFGRYFIVFGGVNDQGQILEDLICFDMVEECWKPFNLIDGRFLKEYLRDLGYMRLAYPERMKM